MNSRAIPIVLLLAVLCFASFGCSQPCNCSCGCDNCTCNGKSAKAAAASPGSSATATGGAPSYKVSIASDEPASSDGQYGEATSNCNITGAEAYVEDGKEYVKVTQTMNVTASDKYGERITTYSPKAYQHSVAVNDDLTLSEDRNRSNEVLAGGNISTDYYYPVGDYSDLLITYGYDGENIGKHQGKAVIHIEKN